MEEGKLPRGFEVMMILKILPESTCSQLPGMQDLDEAPARRSAEVPPRSRFALHQRERAKNPVEVSRADAPRDPAVEGSATRTPPLLPAKCTARLAASETAFSKRSVILRVPAHDGIQKQAESVFLVAREFPGHQLPGLGGGLPVHEPRRFPRPGAS